MLVNAMCLGEDKIGACIIRYKDIRLHELINLQLLIKDYLILFLLLHTLLLPVGLGYNNINANTPVQSGNVRLIFLDAWVISNTSSTCLKNQKSIEQMNHVILVIPTAFSDFIPQVKASIWMAPAKWYMDACRMCCNVLSSKSNGSILREY